MILLLLLQAFFSQCHGIILKRINKYNCSDRCQVPAPIALQKQVHSWVISVFFKTIPLSSVITKGLREAGEL